MTSARCPHWRCQNVCVHICVQMRLRVLILKVSILMVYFWLYNYHAHFHSITKPQKANKNVDERRTPLQGEAIFTQHYNDLIIELNALNKIRAIPTIKIVQVTIANSYQIDIHLHSCFCRSQVFPESSRPVQSMREQTNLKALKQYLLLTRGITVTNVW